MIKSELKRQIKTVKCPYIPQHIMPQSSLLNHLSKCNFPNKHLFTKCKYNPIHVYPNQKIQQHYKKCKNKAQFQNKKPQSSSDQWDCQDQPNQNNILNNINSTHKKQLNSSNQLNQVQPSINQSSIRSKSNQSKGSSEDWGCLISDQQDNEQINKEMQKISVNPVNQQKKQVRNEKEIKKQKIKAQSSILSFTQQEGPDESYLTNGKTNSKSEIKGKQLKEQKKQEKQQKAKYKQKIKSSQNSFSYQSSRQYINKSRRGKRGGKQQSIIQYQKSRENSKVNNSINNSKLNQTNNSKLNQTNNSNVNWESNVSSKLQEEFQIQDF